MLYIFANNKDCIAKTAYAPNTDDLNTRGEIVVESLDDYDITDIVLIDGVITLKPVLPPAPEQILAQLTTAVQRHLDAWARTRNYDNVLALCTYATSTNPRFAAEGQRGVEMRDATWAKCYEILDEVMAGLRGIPTVDELVAELPVLVWPGEEGGGN